MDMSEKMLLSTEPNFLEMVTLRFLNSDNAPMSEAAQLCHKLRHEFDHGNCMIVSDWDTDAPAFCGLNLGSLGY